VVAASIPAILYLVYVFHFAVNVPYADDWLMVPLALSAVHGHVDMSALWRQFDDTRLFLPSLLFVVFALIDHLNEKAIVVFSAGLFVASYLLVILLLRTYLTKRVTFLPVLVIGIVWFSLADVQNALWSFQLAWYLATFWFVVMIYFLITLNRRRTIFLGLSMVAAVAASYSIDQGFIVWPIGLIVLLWNGLSERRTSHGVVAWLVAAVATVAIYLPGYKFVNAACPHTASCTTTYGLLHPGLVLRYLALLVGNVVPTSISADGLDLIVHELLGTLISAAAVFVVVQVIRERRAGVSPLPLVLIVFGVLFDLLIAVGRAGEGQAGALSIRYTMPNLILLVGIVVYACAHIPTYRRGEVRPEPHEWLSAVAALTLGVFLVFQCVTSTRFGLSNGSATHETYETDARVVVNLHSIPIGRQACDISFAVFPIISPTPKNLYLYTRLRNQMERAHLSVLEPSARVVYRVMGPPSTEEIQAAGDFANVRKRWATSCP
jgi:hypothetical protein